MCHTWSAGLLNMFAVMHLLNQRFIAQSNCTRWFEFIVVIFKVDLNDTNLILLSDLDMSGTMQFSSKTQSV